MWLLENVFEKFSHFTQRWVDGLDCFFWASTCSLLSMIFLTLMTIFSTMSKMFIVTLIPLWLLVMEWEFYSHTIPAIRREMHQNNENLNYFKKAFSKVRIFNLKIYLMTNVPALSLSVFYLQDIPIFMVLVIFYQYPTVSFVSCTPLPPGSSRKDKHPEQARLALA